VCWIQHLVLILPCVFLWWRARLAGIPMPRWHPLALGAFAAIALLVHRELMTRSFYEVLISYKPHTLAALLVLLLVLTIPDRAPAVAVESLEVAPPLPNAQAA
jgi:hypothetical protein